MLPPGVREITFGSVGTAVSSLTVPPLPGWIIGTDASGIPVSVNLPPGSTVLVTDDASSDLPTTVAGTVMMTGRQIGDAAPDVVLIDLDADTGSRSPRNRWRQAWHPQSCRLLTSRRPSVDCEGIAVDLIVDLPAGEMRCGNTCIAFRRLPLR